MATEICVDLFTSEIYPWMRKYELKRVSGPNGVYYTTTIPANKKGKLLKTASRYHIKYRYYEKQWARSTTYRNDFFKYYGPPYRCRYCHKKLKDKRAIVIDHIVPVAKTKKSAYARWLLKIRGIKTVNDPKNLAPSCQKCNLRKSDKMGFWVFRGIFGKYKIYWFFYYLLVAILLAIILLFATWMVVGSLTTQPLLDELYQTILQFFSKISK